MMKLYKKLLYRAGVLFLLSGALWMTGCGEKAEEAVNSSKTEEPLVTEAAIQTPTEKPTATPRPTSTPKPTPTNTPTPLPEPRAIDTESTIQGYLAHEIAASMVVGWNLGNTLDSHTSGITYDSKPAKAVKSWGNDEPTKELFEAVKAAGFNTVRIPTTWYQHIKYDKEKEMYVVNEEWLAYVKKTVDYAYEQNLFIILNVHHENWVNVSKFTDATYKKAEQMLSDIWSQVAETFAEYDQHLIFEGMNEPRQTGLGSSVEWGGGDANSRAYINDLNKVFIDTVRNQGSAANKERLLMIPGYAAASNIATIEAIEVPADAGNVALSVHAYYPYSFAMDSSASANHEFPASNYTSSIQYLFTQLKQISDKKQVPIIIGECGASDFNNTEARAKWAGFFFGEAKKAGVPCVLWDNHATYNGTGEAFGLIYRKTYTWYTNSIPMLKAIMEVYGRESYLPEFEEYVEQPFSWEQIPVTEEWIQIYRAEAGTPVETWGNVCLENWKDYLTPEYTIALIYESEQVPYMVLQGGWHKVFAKEEPVNSHMLIFTYDDVEKTMTSERVKLEDMYNYYASASSGPMTLYGVYAVPVK